MHDHLQCRKIKYQIKLQTLNKIYKTNIQHHPQTKPNKKCQMLQDMR